MFPDINKSVCVCVCVCARQGKVMDTRCWWDGVVAVRGPPTLEIDWLPNQPHDTANSAAAAAAAPPPHTHTLLHCSHLPSPL